MGTHDGGPCPRVPASACIEVVHQEQLVISWHRAESVSEDLVELLLILLWEGHRRGVCADEGEVGVACQWEGCSDTKVATELRLCLPPLPLARRHRTLVDQ